MYLQPSIHLEIARENQDFRAKSTRNGNANAALAGRHEDRGRLLTEPPALHEPSPTTTACRPQRVNA